MSLSLYIYIYIIYICIICIHIYIYIYIYIHMNLQICTKHSSSTSPKPPAQVWSGGGGRRRRHCGIFIRRGFRPENPRKRTTNPQCLLTIKALWIFYSTRVSSRKPAKTNNKSHSAVFVVCFANYMR